MIWIFIIVINHFSRYLIIYYNIDRIIYLKIIIIIIFIETPYNKLKNASTVNRVF